MNKISLILIFPVLLLFGCEAVTEKNEACNDTKMAKKEPYLYLKVLVLNDTIYGGDTALFSANAFVVTGKVTKIYCGGKVSGSFDFTRTFYPLLNTYDFSNGERIGQLYQFIFENQLDYLLVQCRIKAYFNDGRIYESDEFLGKAYYSKLQYDLSSNEYYFPFGLNKTVWFRVTQ